MKEMKPVAGIGEQWVDDQLVHRVNGALPGAVPESRGEPKGCLELFRMLQELGLNTPEILDAALEGSNP